MKLLIIIPALFILSLTAFAQDSPKSAMSKLGPNPMFIVDSQKISQSDLAKLNSDSVAGVNVLYDTSAVKLFGDSAKDGVVIIETRAFARRIFISFFRTHSHSYDSLYTTIGNDTSFAYIINDKIQKGNYEGNLSLINEELFIGLEILSKDELITKYNINNKQFGILVKSKKPKDLYNVDQKF